MSGTAEIDHAPRGFSPEKVFLSVGVSHVF
jgi:hypothetical protein